MKVSVENLPGYRPIADSQTHQAIAIYLEEFFQTSLSQARADGHAHILMPSITALRGFFGCTAMEMYDALWEIKRRGYDYQLEGIETPIRFVLMD